MPIRPRGLADHADVWRAREGEAEALADRLYIVEEGRVLAEGTAEALKHQVGGTIRVSVKDGAALGGELAAFGSAVSEDGTVHVVTTQARVGELVDLAMRQGLSATVGPVTLEEAFLRVVGRSIDEE